MVRKELQYKSEEEKLTIVPRYNNRERGTIDQVTYIFNNRLIKRDFYSYTRNMLQNIILGKKRIIKLFFENFIMRMGQLRIPNT